MTPSDFRDSIRNTEWSLCRIATLCDCAETKAGRGPKADIPPRDYQRIADEVSLALETALIPHRS